MVEPIYASLLLALLLIAAVVFDALEDAFNRRTDKARLGHLFGFLLPGSFLVLAVVYAPDFRIFADGLGALIALIGAYVGFRFSLFNPVWNKASKQKINYVGSTSYFDVLEGWYMPAWSFWLTRAFAFVFGCILSYVAITVY